VNGWSTQRLVATLSLVVVGMFGFGFALVPLYDVFCEVTGIRLDDAGRVEASTLDDRAGQSGEVAERWVTVTFDAAVDRGLPWEFGPTEKKMKVRVGELTETLYSATNESGGAVIGHAVPSVSPAGASLYFAKTECFCFTSQRLEAGETRDMPVRFIIAPELPEEITILTLSYRFYNDPEATARAEQDAPVMPETT